MIRELQTLVAVAQHGTFAGAGEYMGLTQSAVSAQIQRLEEHLGFALFDRTGRSAALNAAGKRTLALAQELLSMYERLGDQGDIAGQSGLLNVGAIASAQISLLPQALALFRHDFPAWRIRVVPGVSLNLLAQVDSDEIDSAVIIRPPFALSSELKWHPLVTEPFVLLAPVARAHMNWRDVISAEPFVRYDRRSFGGRQVERFLRRMRLNVRDTIECDELQAIVELVAHGTGVALLPVAAGLGAWPDGVTALPLGDDTFFREVGLVRRSRRDTQPAAERLAGCVIECAARVTQAT
jgi:DNA-binding transcriptional LysR family regulator